MATISEIQQLYIAYFGRPADPEGLDYWISTGISTKDFAAAMYAQPEFQQVNTGLSVSQQVNALYVNLFGREADVEGLTYWTQQINTGKLTLASIANDLIYAANNSTAPQSVIDKAALDNKTATALTYTSDVRESSASFLAYNPTSTNPWVTGPQFASANAFLDTATATNAPNAAAVQASVNAMTAITPPGQTFTLTTNIDTVNISGAAIDTVNGVIANGIANGQTYQTGDTINGNGNTVVNLVVNTDAANVAPIADVNNVAVVNINLASSTAVNDGTLDMAEFDSVGLVAITQGTNAQVLTLADAQFTTSYSVNVARNIQLFFDTFEDDTGAADTLALAVNSAGRAAGDANVDLDGNGVELVNVATAGTNFLFLDNGSDVESYTFTGNGTNDLQINDGVAALTIDASATTGTNVIDLDDGEFSTSDTIIGGTGVDTFNAFLEAGTTAATISGVETIGLVANTASSFFSGINVTGATAINLLDGTVESVTLTAIKSGVQTIGIDGSFGATTDDLIVNYVNGSNSNVTIQVDTGSDTVQGDITVAGNTGALTLSIVGDGDAGDESGFEDIIANNVTAFTLTAADQDVEINNITANASGSFVFVASGGVTIDANGAGVDTDLELNTGNVEVVIDTITLSATGIDGDDNGSSIDLQINAGGNADDETTITDLILVSDADGSINLTVDEATADALLIGNINATASAGDLNLDLSDLGTENGVTVSLGAGDSVVALTNGDDVVSGGAGDATIITVDGADTIIGGSGVETIVMSTSNDGILLSSFDAGASGDIASFDVSAWDTPLAADGIAIAAGNAASLDIVTGGAAWTFDTGNILAISGIIADDNALVSELEGNGAIVAGDLVDGDFILVAYYDGFSTQLRSVELDDVNVSDIVNAIVIGGGTSIEGVNITALANGNFAFA